MNCDPQALIAASREFCCIPSGMQRAVIISLLCEWANNLTPPPTVLIHWTPETENVAWTDGGGLQVGNYAAFVAGVDVATLSQLDFTGSAINTLTGLNSVASLTNVIVTGNALVGIDVTGCTSLLILSAANNAALTSITGLTTCTNLQQLLLDGSDINGTLNVSGLANLTNLVCSSNFNLTGLTLTGCTSLTNVNCDNCNITGTLDVSPAGASLVTLTCANNASLTTLTLTGCTGLQTVNGMNCTSLQTVLGAGVVNVAVGGNGIEFDNCPALVTFNFPDLTNIDEDLHCPACANIPLLATVGGEVVVEDGAVNSAFSAPSLTSIGALASGWFKCVNTTKVTSISVPVLNDVGNDMDFSNSVNIASITATLLNSISSQLILTGCTSLTSLLFPALIGIGAGAAIGGIAGLTSWSAASLILGNSTWSWIGDGLDVTSIAQILARAVASAMPAGTIDVSGGTNSVYATWTPQAQADLITLTGAGIIVNYNP